MDMDEYTEGASAFVGLLASMAVGGIFKAGQVMSAKIDEMEAERKAADEEEARRNAAREAEQREYDRWAEQENAKTQQAIAHSQSQREAQLWANWNSARKALERTERHWRRVVEEKNADLKNLRNEYATVEENLTVELENARMAGMAFAMMAIEYAQKAGVVRQTPNEEDLFRIFIGWMKKRHEIGQWPPENLNVVVEQFRPMLERLVFILRENGLFDKDGRLDLAYVSDKSTGRVDIPAEFDWVMTGPALELLADLEREVKIERAGPSTATPATFVDKNGRRLPRTDMRVRSMAHRIDPALTFKETKPLLEKTRENAKKIEKHLPAVIEKKRTAVLKARMSKRPPV